MHQNDAIERTMTEVIADGAILAVRLGASHSIVDVCRAAVRGGLRVLELTLTTPGALDAIEELAGEKDVIVGAGTVLDPREVEQVAARGGRFALSPVFEPAVIETAHKLGLLTVPGAGTPTEILRAHRAGARLVKVFPSAALGGPEFVRSVSGPFPHWKLVPTSGPTAENLHEYFAAGAVTVGVGREVFAPGFTIDSIADASKRIREAVEAARPE